MCLTLDYDDGDDNDGDDGVGQDDDVHDNDGADDDDGQDDDGDDDDGADDGDFRFAIDGLTEKLHMFPCRKESEALAIIKKHLPFVCIIVYLSSRYDCII